MSSTGGCIPCMAKRAELDNRMEFLRTKAKERAIQSDTNYVIYFDSEDTKLQIAEAKTAIERGCEIVEFISRFADPVK